MRPLPPPAHAAVQARHALIQQYHLVIADLQEGVLRTIEEALDIDLHGAEAWTLDLERGLVSREDHAPVSEP